jgi:hypothetical protein
MLIIMEFGFCRRGNWCGKMERKEGFFGGVGLQAKIPCDWKRKAEIVSENG